MNSTVKVHYYPYFQLFIKKSRKNYMQKSSKIFVAGHRGMVGSAILRKLESLGFQEFALAGSTELDLRNQLEVNEFFRKEKPMYVFLAAAKVGGILANDTYRADFLYDNLMIEANVIHSAYQHGVKKLMFLGSSCIYPKMAPQPLQENALLTGLLEPTNEPYAIAKIAGIKLCDAYRTQYGCNFVSVMPTNLYGPNDNYPTHKTATCCPQCCDASMKPSAMPCLL
jgi:GDP-L-fucose synthase